MPQSSGPLPPSVEKAYRRKCIELRRRINEIEEHNDATRLRVRRLSRAIMKMRLERAFLLEQLAERMEYNGDESDRSDSPLPTPQEKPLRSKRSHRKASPSQNNQASSVAAANSPPPQDANSQTGHAAASTQSTPDPHHSSAFFAGSPSSQTVNGSAIHQRYESPTEGSTYARRRLSPADNPYSSNVEGSPEDRRRTQENGDGPDRRYSDSGSGARLHGGSTQTDANGNGRGQTDTEMGEAESSTQRGGFGFTAVNQ